MEVESLKPNIVPSDFTPSQLECIASLLYYAASKFYAEPENQKEYEAYAAKEKAVNA